MDEATAKRPAYSWGGRFHLATEVESEFGKSLKTQCGVLHNPATVKAKVLWGQVPLALVCRECLAHEQDAPEPTKALGLDPAMWPDMGVIAEEAEAWEKAHPTTMVVLKGGSL